MMKSIHRKDAKNAKYFILFFRDFLCDLCVSAVKTFNGSGLLAPAQFFAQDIEVVVTGRMEEPQVMVVPAHRDPVPGIQGEIDLPVTGNLGLQRAFVDDDLDA
jgi:hypothetical protein